MIDPLPLKLEPLQYSIVYNSVFYLEDITYLP